jgi:Ni/Co efflux regulator RcnB
MLEKSGGADKLRLSLLKGEQFMRRIVAVLMVAAVLAAMLASPALAASNDRHQNNRNAEYTCFKKNKVKHNLTVKQKNRLENHGWDCIKERN